MAHFLDEVDGAALMDMQFPELHWIIQDVIPEGMTLLAGPSKGNKSFLMLQVCRALCQSHDVLYLALEDTKRRLQTRTLLQQGEALTRRLTLVPTGGTEKMRNGGIKRILNWIHNVPSPRLVVVDTLEKFRDARGEGSSMYASDYDTIGKLKALADTYRLAVIVVHHTKKEVDERDPFNEISGSTGLMGAADTAVMLVRQRHTNMATLHVTGRDVEEAKREVLWDEATWRWQLEAVVAPVVVDAELVAWITQSGPKTRAQVRAAFRDRPLRELLADLDGAVRAGALLDVDGWIQAPAGNVVPLRG